MKKDIPVHLVDLTEGLIMVQVSAVISNLSKIAKVAIMISTLVSDFFLLKDRLSSIQNGEY
jgi:hypothetical protein